MPDMVRLWILGRNRIRALWGTSHRKCASRDGWKGGLSCQTSMSIPTASAQATPSPWLRMPCASMWSNPRNSPADSSSGQWSEKRGTGHNRKQRIKRDKFSVKAFYQTIYPDSAPEFCSFATGQVVGCKWANLVALLRHWQSGVWILQTFHNARKPVWNGLFGFAKGPQLTCNCGPLPLQV